MTTKRTGAKIVMEALVRQGVNTIFGYPGGVVLPLYDEMLNWPQVKHVLVRHEQCAAHAADGYARSTGKVGVCLATSGPGATNLVTGIANALLDSVPMVAITGNVNSWALGTDAFQETDVQGITIPITKHNYVVTEADDLPGVLEEAFFLASTGRKGPVLVDITKDAFLKTSDIPFPERVERRGYTAQVPVDLLALGEAEQALAAAERPVVIAGAGVLWSNSSQELIALADKCDLPVINSLLGLGVFPRNDPRSLGMMGMHGEQAATTAVQNADLVLAIGIRFDDRLTGKTSGFAPNATVVHFDTDASEFSKCIAAHIPVRGDLAQSLGAFLKRAPQKSHGSWWSQIRQWQAEFPIVVPPKDRLLARHVIAELDRATQSEAIISTDVGQHQMWTAQLYQFKRPYQWLSSGGLGTMGFGFPAAIGAAFANPGKEVWAVVGDGGFQMTMQELITAVEHNLDVKICLVNNGYLGMVRQWQEMFYDNRYSHVVMGSPDYGKLAEAYGVHYIQCSTNDALADTIEAARRAPGPVLCEFIVEMEENVFPMVAAGATNDHILADPLNRKSEVPA
ncbi:MAG: biosynthetic-type acetolactate synthase large subunit [Armatimonadetes bacterium]|nr:biosynthetic-type acetolactate synthase large subunit [Armatimonadota bacterium]